MSVRDPRQMLQELVSKRILPLANRFKYSPETFNPNANWKPTILVVGNYSSGKSTLINEITGGTVQRTGQAPTDDCFTILTAADDSPDLEPMEVAEEIAGHTLVNDPKLPFGRFRRFGDRFLAHFVMKKIQAPALRDFALIDSPGMLDSVTERDRGYDYHLVLGQLAELADLVVLMFDPHKAGTIRETYDSIRSTLPLATSEDRVLFVMNRIDECRNVSDLLRSFGALCWNLSQMTGRKDVPRVYLTFSPSSKDHYPALNELRTEREELINRISDAPRVQTNNWLGKVDNNLRKLELIAQAMNAAATRYRTAFTSLLTRTAIGGLVGIVVIDTLLDWLVSHPRIGLIGRFFANDIGVATWIVPIVLLVLVLTGGYYYIAKIWKPRFHQRLLENVDELPKLPDRYSRDLWESVRKHVLTILEDPASYSLFSSYTRPLASLRKIIDVDLRELYEVHFRRRNSASNSSISTLGDKHAPPSQGAGDDSHHPSSVANASSSH